MFDFTKGLKDIPGFDSVKMFCFYGSQIPETIARDKRSGPVAVFKTTSELLSINREVIINTLEALFEPEEAVSALTHLSEEKCIIFVDLDSLIGLTTNEKSFMIHHELGHIVHGDLDCSVLDDSWDLNQEISADLYAAKITGKEVAISTLSKFENYHDLTTLTPADILMLKYTSKRRIDALEKM